MNNYTKFLADLTNVDEMIKDEDRVLILLSSLPDEEHKIIVLTFINGKASLSYNDASVAFVNCEVSKKDKESSSGSITAEASTTRGMSSNHPKGNGDVGKPKIGIAN